MLKNLDGFVELGTAECEQGCGGIWMARLPIFVNGEKLDLIYDSEAYHNDDNLPEFLVYGMCDADDWKTDYGDDEENPGMFIHIEKDSPLFGLYKKLRRAMARAIATNMAVKSKPIAKGIKVMEEYYEEHPLLTVSKVAQKLCDMLGEDMEEEKYFEDWGCVGTDKIDSVRLVFENGQQFQITVEEL